MSWEIPVLAPHAMNGDVVRVQLHQAPHAAAMWCSVRILRNMKIVVFSIGPETSGGFYEYSSLLCLLVTALSLTTTAGSDKLKEFARVGIFSTAITKFIWVNCWKHNILQQKCHLFGLIDIFARQILCVELSPHVKYNSRCHFICYQQVCPLILLPTV